MLNILNVGPTPPRVGGSAYANIELLVALAERGHRVRCISHMSTQDMARADRDFAWEGSQLEVYPLGPEYIRSAHEPTAGEMITRSARTTTKLNELIDEEDPDVLMIGHESLAPYTTPEARRLGLPIVQVLHGSLTQRMDAGEFTPGYTDLFFKAVSAADVVVGVSDYLADVVRRHRVTHATYIHNGTDTGLFTPVDSKDPHFLESLGIPEGSTVVLHASNLKAIKRPLDIVESAAEAVRLQPSLVYVIAGDGDLREAMEDRARELGVYDNFRFVGIVPFQRIPKYFQNADIFALPSESEGFGRVIREAQASGAVPIASNVGALPEVITHGTDGLVYPVGDTKGLTRSVLYLANNPNDRLRMARAGRVTAVENNFAAMVGSYERALHTAIERREALASRRGSPAYEPASQVSLS